MPGYNLCDLPQEEQDAIQKDRELWYQANQLLVENARLRQPGFVQNHLNSIADPDERADFERRLIAIKNRKSK